MPSPCKRTAALGRAGGAFPFRQEGNSARRRWHGFTLLGATVASPAILKTHRSPPPQRSPHLLSPDTAPIPCQHAVEHDHLAWGRARRPRLGTQHHAKGMRHLQKATGLTHHRVLRLSVVLKPGSGAAMPARHSHPHFSFHQIHVCHCTTVPVSPQAAESWGTPPTTKDQTLKTNPARWCNHQANQPNQPEHHRAHTKHWETSPSPMKPPPTVPTGDLPATSCASRATSGS